MSSNTATLPLREAARDWHRSDLFLGSDGQYRLKNNHGRVAPYSKALVAAFPENLTFHQCARAVCTCDAPDDCYSCAFGAHPFCSHGCGAA